MKKKTIFVLTGVLAPVLVLLFQNATTYPQHRIVGRIDYVRSLPDGNVAIGGWSCDYGKSESINVHVYVGGAAGTGVKIKTVLASLPSEPAVGNACGDSANAPHRFKYVMPYELLKQYAGQLIYVHGISITGGRNLLLSESGKYAVPQPQKFVLGFIDGIVQNPQKDGYLIRGWACQKETNQSVAVHVYFGHPSGQGVVAKAGIADQVSSAAVGEQCATTLGRHTFSIPLSAREYRRYAGQKLFVYGISLIPGGYNNALARSGIHSPQEVSFTEVACDQWNGVVDKNIRLAPGCAYKGQIFFNTPDVTLDCNGGSVTPLDPETIADGTIGQGFSLLSAKKACEEAPLANDGSKQYFIDPRIDGTVIKNCSISQFRFGLYFKRQVWIKSKVSGKCTSLGEFPTSDSRSGSVADLDAYLGGRSKRYDFHPSSITLRNVHISAAKENGLYVNEYAKDWLVEDSSFNLNPKGVYLERESIGTRIFNSEIKNNRVVGIAVDASAKNIFERNIFDNNGSAGISLYRNCGEKAGVPRYAHSNNNVIQRNVIKNHVGRKDLITLTTKFIESEAQKFGVGVWVASRQGMTPESILAAYPGATKVCLDEPVQTTSGEVYRDYASANVIRDNTMADNLFANVLVEDDNNIVMNNNFSTPKQTAAYADVVVGSVFRQSDAEKGPVSGNKILGNKSTSLTVNGSYLSLFGSSKDNNLFENNVNP